MCAGIGATTRRICPCAADADPESPGAAASVAWSDRASNRRTRDFQSNDDRACRGGRRSAATVTAVGNGGIGVVARKSRAHG